MIRALWGPRLREAIDWVASEVEARTRRAHHPGGRGARDARAVRGRTDRALRPDRPAQRRQPGRRRLQDRPAAEHRRGARGVQPATRAARADRRARQVRRRRPAPRPGSNIGRWRAITAAAGSAMSTARAIPKKRDPIPADEFVARATRNFEGAAAKWLTGERAVHRQTAPRIRALWRLRPVDAPRRMVRA